MCLCVTRNCLHWRCGQPSEGGMYIGYYQFTPESDIIVIDIVIWIIYCFLPSLSPCGGCFCLLQYCLPVQAKFQKADAQTTTSTSSSLVYHCGMGYPKVSLSYAQGTLSGTPLFAFQIQHWSNGWQGNREELGQDEPCGQQH